MPEMQKVLSSFSESQDFKDLETARSSGTADAPGKPTVFLSCFQALLAAIRATFLTNGM